MEEMVRQAHEYVAADVKDHNLGIIDFNQGYHKAIKHIHDLIKKLP